MPRLHTTHCTLIRTQSFADDINIYKTDLLIFTHPSLMKYISSPFITIFEGSFYFLALMKTSHPLMSQVEAVTTFWHFTYPDPLSTATLPRTYHLPASCMLPSTYQTLYDLTRSPSTLSFLTHYLDTISSFLYTLSLFKLLLATHSPPDTPNVGPLPQSQYAEKQRLLKRTH